MYEITLWCELTRLVDKMCNLCWVAIKSRRAGAFEACRLGMSCNLHTALLTVGCDLVIYQVLNVACILVLASVRFVNILQYVMHYIMYVVSKLKMSASNG